ncbi:sigma-70 family RNA polymerase sigma factor [Streptomyces sp. NPDC051776]|uniref:sigma-70 family RNA polymerase sigma factor n=1 Tax=Streptomyces sp. NPDC051776 TaxID=3155414 RepID=UPI0034445FFC
MIEEPAARGGKPAAAPVAADRRPPAQAQVGSGQSTAVRPIPARDEAFIRAVYEQHGSVLLRFATGLLNGDRYQAEDVLQEAVLRAWRRVDALDAPPHTLRPWLFTVVRNQVIDIHRSRQARPAECGDFALADHPGVDEIERTLTAQLVLELLDDLAPPHREVIVHVYWMGRSVTETAKELNIPPGTVKSRTYYAMRALRHALESRGMPV